MQLSSRAKAWAPWVVLAASYAAFLFYAFPGFTSPDSAMQLAQARAHTYSDWHPPAMAALWGVVEHVVRGPAGMLVLQSTAFLAGAYRLYRRAFSALASAALAGATLLFPPVLATMAVIWKDSQMAGYLLLGASLVLDERWRARIPGLALLGLACAMRDNAPAAVLPIVVIAFARGKRWLRRTAVSLAICTVLTGAAMTVNRVLRTDQSHVWYFALAPFDIVGTVRYAPRSDRTLENVLAGTGLRVHHDIARAMRGAYTPRNWWGIMNGPDRVFDYPGTREARDAIAHAWWREVTGAPRAYTWHRLQVVREAVGLSHEDLFDSVWYGRLVESTEPRASQTAIAKILEWLAANAYLFHPIVYLLFALCTLIFGRRQRDIVMLVVSGIVYELTLLVFAASPDVRYSHWMTSTTLIAAIVMMRRVRGGEMT